MKLLFLDIDGVLCTMRSHAAADPKFSGLMVALDPVGVQLVNRICEASGAKIVLSTSWRHVFGIHETYCHLRGAGLHSEHLIWTKDKEGTPNKMGLRSRGAEIAHYLEDNPADVYCIIDDDTDMLTDQKPFFVRTCPVNGLMWEHAKRAAEILGAKL